MAAQLSLEAVLDLYSRGGYLMSDEDKPNAYGQIPEKRGIFDLNKIHVPKRLRRTILSQVFNVTVDQNFSRVVEECANKKGRGKPWLNQQIKDVFNKFHELGLAHSIECWKDDQLAGGLYGLHLGSVFFGESMFTADGQRDASKVAFTHLAARLWHGGFTILDSQMYLPHWESFGQQEIAQDKFEAPLQRALEQQAEFFSKEKTEIEMVRSYLEFIR